MEIWMFEKDIRCEPVTWYVTFEYMLHMLSCYRTFKLLKRYFCTYDPQLDISLKKNTTTFKFAHALPVAVFYAMVFANKIFSKRKYFISNLQTCKYTLFRSL